MWLTFVVFPASAAVQYEFIQHTQSDVSLSRPSNLTGRALIDGDRSRVDFLTGDLYPPGTYCLVEGSRRMTFVDPVRKSYTEINGTALAAAMGSNSILISNLKTDTNKLEDHPFFAGVSTDHYRLSIDFDMAVQFHSVPLRQSVHAEIDKWTTIEYADVSDAFASSVVRTGNAEVDKIIDLETGKLRGFPLKQTVKITTRNLQGQIPNSKLALSETRTQSREILVTSIKRVDVQPLDFVLPASYQRNDMQAVAEKQARTQFTVLSFEEGKQ